MAPQLADEIFYAGLLHEIGCVDSLDGIREDSIYNTSVPVAGIGLYPAKGAAILAHSTEMRSISQYIHCHHERFDGTGYPSGIDSDSIPLGGQILALAEAVALSGFLNGNRGKSEYLHQLVPYVNRAWHSALWVAFLKSVSCKEYYGAIIDPLAIDELMQSVIAQTKCPVNDDNKGIEVLLQISASLVDNKDPSISGHSLRVAKESMLIAKHIGLDANFQTEVYHAGLVHDLGKIIIPARILNRPGPISDEERLVVMRHVDVVLRVWCSIMKSEWLKHLSNQAFHDHERYDGEGYPDRLKGDEIPVVSRIISVADSFDVMTASDSYRFASPKGALVKIRQESGRQFDSNIVDAFISMKSGEEYQQAA
jgi:response regulator RpfG family c-di-GMP phosphodiesterase